MLLWLKALHLIFMVTWFAGLFYLPRLFVYHAMSTDEVSIARFKIMERKLFYGIMTPGAALTLLAGIGMLGVLGFDWLIQSGWMQLKLGLVFLLACYHVYLGYLVKSFAQDNNRHGHVYYRWLNEAPVIVLVAVVLLAVLKPWSS